MRLRIGPLFLVTVTHSKITMAQHKALTVGGSMAGLLNAKALRGSDRTKGCLEGTPEPSRERDTVVLTHKALLALWAHAEVHTSDGFNAPSTRPVSFDKLGRRTAEIHFPQNLMG
jgi:hypothetical protein